MSFALIISSLSSGGAAIACAASIVVWNLSGLLFVCSGLGINPTVPPLSPQR
ncbi:MAG TPA: hypothetical protein VFI32_09990 [Rhodanobacteraceae bacterium]|nr:hypothetical protein [Rhodanobacteraceae bacterium]